MAEQKQKQKQKQKRERDDICVDTRDLKKTRTQLLELWRVSQVIGRQCRSDARFHNFYGKKKS